MSADCFFIIPDETTPITAICLKCMPEPQENAYFWNGSKKGYGNYDLNCCICKEVIHKFGEKDENTVQ